MVYCITIYCGMQYYYTNVFTDTKSYYATVCYIGLCTIFYYIHTDTLPVLLFSTTLSLYLHHSHVVFPQMLLCSFSSCVLPIPVHVLPGCSYFSTCTAAQPNSPQINSGESFQIQGFCHKRVIIVKIIILLEGIYHIIF